ncbi:hypothetical protein SSP24_80500 [Streptomyces spinoverrucosus]|uniref:HTH lysR-type domain-containing protein n=1 Tax=Streptomyces spinoverrucosus TaxID=284043 RepID=A0A4Y3VW78_9ACTN|nr:LysR family transcriptional regulator [Streptomyces spinoverrucosus]GEC10395.1 hypothetical protein SSP24_80500 [Streptomyces spinoverrucosus]GHB93854.1 hypothetical protein GCM10010397_78380 [Streptomyces spinoverrucosus]
MPFVRFSAFLAVADEGSITRAAARLHLTQQAVSGQIQQSEKVVGTTLLRRTPHGVTPSAAGRELAKRGAALLDQAEDMLTEVRMVGAGRSGRLRIAFKAQSTAHFMNGHRLPRAGAGVPQGVEDGNAGAHRRRGLLEGHLLGNPGGRVLGRHHVLRVAPVVGEADDLPVDAVHEVARAAECAAEAAAAVPAHAHPVTDLPPHTPHA